MKRTTVYGKARTGWLITSAVPLPILRRGVRSWCERLTVVHEPSGRYFAQPRKGYLATRLRACQATDWSGQEEFFHCPQRAERLRRLEPFLEVPNTGRGRCGSLFARRLALRLESLPRLPCQKAAWSHMACDFDQMWESLPLFAQSLDPLLCQVLKLFCQALARKTEMRG